MFCYIAAFCNVNDRSLTKYNKLYLAHDVFNVIFRVFVYHVTFNYVLMGVSPGLHCFKEILNHGTGCGFKHHDCATSVLYDRKRFRYRKIEYNCYAKYNKHECFIVTIVLVSRPMWRWLDICIIMPIFMYIIAFLTVRLQFYPSYISLTIQTSS